MTQKIFMVFAILVALTMTAFSNYHEKKINNSPVLGCFLAMKEQQPYEINFNLNKINETIFEIEINMTL